MIKQETAVAEQASQVDVSADGELQISTNVATAIEEIRAAMLLAKRFPRSIDAAWQSLQSAVRRKKFAALCRYVLPTGGKQIQGPSVHLAREAARCFTNMRYGMAIVYDDEKTREVQGWAWDIENNTKPQLSAVFEKIIWDKKEKRYRPLKPHEIRQFTQAEGARLIRNCIYSLIPRDMIDDAIETAKGTMKSTMADPDMEKKQLLSRFMELGVSVEKILRYFDTEELTVDDIVDLKGIYLTIKEGAASVKDYFSTREETADEPKTGNLSTDDMKPGDSADHQSVQGQPEKPKDKVEAGKKNVPGQNKLGEDF